MRWKYAPTAEKKVSTGRIPRKITHFNGIKFDSKWESTVYIAKVYPREQKGEIVDVKIHAPTFELIVNGSLVCKYTPDYTYFDYGLATSATPGRYVIHEAKGFAEKDFPIRWKLMQACYPDFEYRLDKQPSWKKKRK